MMRKHRVPPVAALSREVNSTVGFALITLFVARSASSREYVSVRCPNCGSALIMVSNFVGWLVCGCCGCLIPKQERGERE